MNSYRATRNYENMQRARFRGVGEYGIPVLPPVKSCDVENWISFNYVKGCDDPEDHGVHFFIDDYQFERVWKQPDVYTSMLKRFQAVCAPDFSLYADFPKALQLYNHYRKHWCGAYWRAHGVTVIPTVCWADRESYSWCFDGDPRGSVVAVGSVGTQNSPEARKLFIQGYKEMLRRLQPTKIIFYGMVPDECKGNIVQVRSFAQNRWK